VGAARLWRPGRRCRRRVRGRTCQVAFDHAGLNWEDHVRVDERYFRPAEVDLLIGDAGKARLRLGWEPTIGFEELVTGLVDADIELMTGKLDTLA
jgi:GDPmannose 4,6-dehydratase